MTVVITLAQIAPISWRALWKRFVGIPSARTGVTVVIILEFLGSADLLDGLLAGLMEEICGNDEVHLPQPSEIDCRSH